MLHHFSILVSVHKGADAVFGLWKLFSCPWQIILHQKHSVAEQSGHNVHAYNVHMQKKTLSEVTFYSTHRHTHLHPLLFLLFRFC